MSPRIPDADFDAIAMEIHLTTDRQEAALTIIGESGALTVSVPRKALEEFRDRISRVLDA